MKNTLNIITMGCSKNLVDSEHLAARAAAAGWQVVFDSNDTDARTVVVNTCGFIGDAKEESVDMILSLAQARARGRLDRLYVIGCLSERYAEQLRAEIPEVDAFFGARGIDAIAAELTGLALKHKTTGAPTSPATSSDGSRAACSTRRLLSTPPHYAYLKISEGCDRRCGFCAIPLIRGPHVSVPMERLIDEATELAAKGVKELIVIAQDTTFYGLDIYGERRLALLLRRLARIDGIEWIRLHYAYPAGFPDDVIEVMRSEPKVCNYLDIPLQHIADGQLRAMKRGLGAVGSRELIARLRAAIPGLALRTTMLVGYPGETGDDFDELVDFVREARFERLGVFPYSAEEGTFSATELTDNVPDEVKNARIERLMEVQAAVSAEINAARVGSVERVIVDRREGEHWVCRSQYDSPEVDGEILVTVTDCRPESTISGQNIRVGDFISVRISSASEYDLLAEII